MTDTPAQIWATLDGVAHSRDGAPDLHFGSWKTYDPYMQSSKYTRSNLHPTSAELLAWAHSGTSRDGLLTSQYEAILAYADAMDAAEGSKDDN